MLVIVPGAHVYCRYLCTCMYHTTLAPVYQVTWRQREEEQDGQGEECKRSKVVIKPFCNDGKYGDGEPRDCETCWPGRLQRILQHSMMLSWGANIMNNDVL